MNAYDVLNEIQQALSECGQIALAGKVGLLLTALMELCGLLIRAHSVMGRSKRMDYEAHVAAFKKDVNATFGKIGQPPIR